MRSVADWKPDEPLSWPLILGVIFRQKDRQIPSIAVVVVVFFLFWNFLAHMIFALFMGLQVMTNVSSSLDVFLTPNGLMMLAVGTAIGAVFAGVLFAMTVVSLPLLLDREVDFVTAMITSVSTVRENPLVMLVWGGVIAALLFAGMALWFLGLVRGAAGSGPCNVGISIDAHFPDARKHLTAK